MHQEAYGCLTCLTWPLSAVIAQDLVASDVWLKVIEQDMPLLLTILFIATLWQWYSLKRFFFDNDIHCNAFFGQRYSLKRFCWQGYWLLHMYDVTRWLSGSFMREVRRGFCTHLPYARLLGGIYSCSKIEWDSLETSSVEKKVKTRFHVR